MDLIKDAFFPCYGLAEATLFVTGHTPFTPYHTLTLAKEQYQDHRRSLLLKKEVLIVIAWSAVAS